METEHSYSMTQLRMWFNQKINAAKPCGIVLKTGTDAENGTCVSVVLYFAHFYQSSTMSKILSSNCLITNLAVN